MVNYEVMDLQKSDKCNRGYFFLNIPMVKIPHYNTVSFTHFSYSIMYFFVVLFGYVLCPRCMTLYVVRLSCNDVRLMPVGHHQLVTTR